MGMYSMAILDLMHTLLDHACEEGYVCSFRTKLLFEQLGPQFSLLRKCIIKICNLPLFPLFWFLNSKLETFFKLRAKFMVACSL